MTEEELKEKLSEIKSKTRLFTTMIPYDWKLEKHYITEEQYNLFESLFNLFESLNWQVALNSYKELKVENDEPIDKIKCGTPVKVRPCADKYGDKTYFGILLGNIPLSIRTSIDKNETLTIKRGMYNPAIYIPELKDIVFGCGSWWGEIKSEDELKELITDETINNVWYVRLLSGKGNGEK